MYAPRKSRHAAAVEGSSAQLPVPRRFPSSQGAGNRPGSPNQRLRSQSSLGSCSASPASKGRRGTADVPCPRETSSSSCGAGGTACFLATCAGSNRACGHRPCSFGHPFQLRWQVPTPTLDRSAKRRLPRVRKALRSLATSEAREQPCPCPPALAFFPGMKRSVPPFLALPPCFSVTSAATAAEGASLRARLL